MERSETHVPAKPQSLTEARSPLSNDKSRHMGGWRLPLRLGRVYTGANAAELSFPISHDKQNPRRDRLSVSPDKQEPARRLKGEDRERATKRQELGQGGPHP